MTTQFHLPKDTDIRCTQSNVTALLRDVKHSKHWQCKFCGAPAREADFQNVSWPHLNPPRLVTHAHFICHIDEPHVRKGLIATHGMLQRLGSAGPMPPYASLPKRPAGVVFPLAGSCAFCERDETAGGDRDGEPQLGRCSGCRMTRYCGVECQRRDWRRHKVTCARVHTVEFENWD
ncbi:hypothetical protein TRAPUB_1469 [Trametes pubescens]|uniref:MYND-type domain-containing protein n=1 Tax=Trametes pubescens TaxID=154538 RepID=A0A1M2VJB7_TRAPU|nr:hypothetical protein TRAPUB_1469 [Trametes pubescens]